ncbi:DAZ interacting zinc finger protein 1 isoform X2 [Osmia lignaria lignaria]|uniref:DAZ interacting zinc finger protein 1 isoform X2 n=1 Tax=Osmia lignaria lignaria TaxID=1437193 RepID=UPI00402B19A5
MAFSLHIGTKWCHDFPKLARESGFYFDKHKSKVRIDWNRISSIDIDRVIRERDFYTIDDNINNVIDYCLESEYDVKILDSNFVKLFRLAQLAVEYLLYCKQYLDHSVIILKDELRSKIEENVKLKKEITTLEEMIKRLKEKTKERNRLIETKIGDCSGEIYKCPHCPKTFISSMFVSAHVIRRHAYTSDLYMPASPIHEHYRNETEKLHNEIKNLKERLNETEKVIRNEAEKVSDKKTIEYDKKQSEQEAESFKHNVNKSEEYHEYKGYQEEIKNLKTMLFDEIHNLRQKEKTMYEYKAETNMQTLMNQQEKEFQKLRNQLFEKLNPDIESMHAKLFAQENFWKSKIEQLEHHHQKDVERLTIELKLTQKIADSMKAEYESKVNYLERQAANQSNILTEQSKQLHSLSNEINVSQLNEKSYDSENNLPKKYNQSAILKQFNETEKKSNENDFKKESQLSMKTQKIIVGNINSISSDPSNKEILLALENKLPESMHTLKPRTQTIMCESKGSVEQESTETMKDIKFDNENKRNDTSESKDLIFETENDYEIEQKKQDLTIESIKKAELNESNICKLKGSSVKNISQDFLSRVKNNKLETLSDNYSSETSSELSVSDSRIPSEIESITRIRNNYPLHKYITHTSVSSKPKRLTEYDSLYKKLQINLKDIFEQKLRDLGIDPEWQGIPKATFKQKMDILKHHQKIATKKLPKYHQIKLKIIKEVLDKISKKDKVAESLKHFKKSPSHKSVTAVKPASLDDKKNISNTSPLRGTASNDFHSTLEGDHSIRRVIDDESSVKSIKLANIKATEKLIQLTQDSIKSTGNIQHAINSQESSVQRGSFSKMKTLFNSEQFNTTLNDKDILNDKLVKNNSMGNLNMEQQLQNVSVSPKYNKSVLKSATASTSSLMKKKVIFDLGNERDEESLSDYGVEEEESLSDCDKKKGESNESNWNTDGRKHLTGTEVYKNSDNIILKTTQSDKIAEISRKLEAQLNMVRQKPVGSVETIFSSTYKQGTRNENIMKNENENENINYTSINSFLESSFRTSNSKLTNELLLSPHNVKDKAAPLGCTIATHPDVVVKAFNTEMSQ